MNILLISGEYGSGVFEPCECPRLPLHDGLLHNQVRLGSLFEFDLLNEVLDVFVGGLHEVDTPSTQVVDLYELLQLLLRYQSLERVQLSGDILQIESVELLDDLVLGGTRPEDRLAVAQDAIVQGFQGIHASVLLVFPVVPCQEQHLLQFIQSINCLFRSAKVLILCIPQILLKL